MKRKFIEYRGDSMKDSPYFESWLFKIVTKKQEIFFINPGIHYGNTSYAFIQLYETITNSNQFFVFPIEDFYYLKEPFELHIKNNIFTLSTVKLCLENKNYKCKGELYFSNVQKKPFENTLLLREFPTLEPYFTTSYLTPYYKVFGTLWINRKKIYLEDASGSLKKEYGKKYPNHLLYFSSNTSKKDGKAKNNVYFLIYPSRISFFQCHIQIGKESFYFSSSQLSKVKFQKQDDTHFFVFFRKLGISCKCRIELLNPNYFIFPNEMTNDFYWISFHSKATIVLKKKKRTYKERFICGDFFHL